LTDATSKVGGDGGWVKTAMTVINIRNVVDRS
jgi:hypothetical protein